MPLKDLFDAWLSEASTRLQEAGHTVAVEDNGQRVTLNIDTDRHVAQAIYHRSADIADLQIVDVDSSADVMNVCVFTDAQFRTTAATFERLLMA